jgi:hypothetical protein
LLHEHAVALGRVFQQRIEHLVGSIRMIMPPTTAHADVENGAFALLAMALARLPESQRERYLSDIERGDLRKAVAQILRPPYPPVASGRLQ